MANLTLTINQLEMLEDTELIRIVANTDKFSKSTRDNANHELFVRDRIALTRANRP